MAPRKKAEQPPKAPAKPNSEKKKTRGAPSTYSIEKAKEICAWIASGQSLKAYCRQPNTPSVPTVYAWRAAHDEFANLYARAREDQADALAEEILDIADDSKLDPNDRRVKIDARKWIASKLKPKLYGDHVRADVTGKLTLEQLVLGSFKMSEAPPV